MSKSPLELPEILANVLQHVDSKTLVASAQVNSLWAEEAVTWIWRGDYRSLEPWQSSTPALRQLEIMPQERRDWYCKKIRHLTIEPDRDSNGGIPEQQEIITLLKQIEFNAPNLTSLIIEAGSENMKEADMAMFLEPHLVCLEFFGGYYTRWFLDRVRARAPNLRAWLVDNGLALIEHGPWEDLTANDFLEFLIQVPSIRHLELIMGYDSLLDERLMRHLLTRPNLEWLRLDPEKLLRHDTLMKQSSDGSPTGLFSNMRYLEVTAEERALRFLLPNLSRLQHLSIELADAPPDGTDRVLNSLANCCPQLEELLLNSEVAFVVPSTALVSIVTKCPSLRRLEVEHSERGITCDDSFHDGLMEELASKLKNIETLSLPFHNKLTFKSLVSLARHCYRLYDLSLSIALDLHELDTEPDDVVFYSLRDLELFQLTFRSFSAGQDHAVVSNALLEILDRRIPLLVSLRLNDQSNAELRDRKALNAIRTVLGNRDYPSRDTRPERLRLLLKRTLIEGKKGGRYGLF